MNRRFALAIAALVMAAACSSTSTAAVSPNPTQSPSPSSFITTVPSAAPSPSGADLPVSKVSFSCRLPIMVETTGNNPVWFQGGFVAFPSASFGIDANGRVNSTGGGSVLTTASAPVLNGAPQTGLPAYDVQLNRWLPVGAGQVSADGTSYAYSSLGEKKIHVVSVRSGADQVFDVNVPAAGGTGLAVEDYEDSSVYFASGYPEGPSTGLWRLDVATGAVSQVAQIANVFAVRGGAAWVGFLDPHDPTPPTDASGSPEFDSVIRVDLATGARTTWDYRPGRSLVVNAVSANGDVVLTVHDPTGGSAPEIRHLSSPVSGGEDNGDLVYSGPLSFDVPQIDGDRIWLGNDRGIYLYTPDGGLQKVYAFNPASNQSVYPAGLCR